MGRSGVITKEYKGKENMSYHDTIRYQISMMSGENGLK